MARRGVTKAAPSASSTVGASVGATVGEDGMPPVVATFGAPFGGTLVAVSGDAVFGDAALALACVTFASTRAARAFPSARAFAISFLSRPKSPRRLTSSFTDAGDTGAESSIPVDARVDSWAPISLLGR
jgi:hypothetical protein